MRYSKIIPALAATAVLVAGGATVADAAGGDAAITVSTPTTLRAGQKAPFSAAGVKAIRRGKAIPSGYALVGRAVTIEGGTAGSTGAATTLTCPSGKTARTLGFTGQLGPNPIGDYVSHRSVRITVWNNPNHTNAHGTSYVVCR